MSSSSSSSPDQTSRTLARSGDVLVDYLQDVDFDLTSADFFVLELARLSEEGVATFENEEFREFVREALRIHVNPSLSIRARIALTLRGKRRGMPTPARRVADDVIGAVEDSDFSLEHVGAVAAAYTRALVRALEAASNGPSGSSDVDGGPEQAEAAAREAVSAWEAGDLSFEGLKARLGDLGNAALPAIADLLLDDPADPVKTDAALDLFGERTDPVTARTLAFAVSEPLLGESQELRAVTLLRQVWPAGRPFVLYHLRKHEHDDIPFRWLELLVRTSETRAVDRILEELVQHAREESSAEDLRAILKLLDQAPDPGLEGKIIRFMTNPAAPPEALDLLEEWLDQSSVADGVAHALSRWQDGSRVVVSGEEDFLAFAFRGQNPTLSDAWADWTRAYHERLGWQRYTDYPWSEIELELDRDLLDLVVALTGTGRVDPDTARPLLERVRDERLLVPDPPPLASVLDDRPRNDPWREETFQGELNEWFVRAAASCDAGDIERGRRILNLLRNADPSSELPNALLETISGPEAQTPDRDR